MGTVCSSKNKSGDRQDSLTSLSEAANDSSKTGQKNTPHSTVSDKYAFDLSGDIGVGLRPVSKTVTSTRSELDKLTTTTITDTTSEDLLCRRRSPHFVAPPRLRRVPPQMQNLLMGRWPVPPTPGCRIMRIFLAAEEEDSRTERTWLTKKVFPGLRSYTEKLGFHLHIVDTHSLLPTPGVPRAYLRDITKRVMEEKIDIWLIFLNYKLGWSLPTTIDPLDYSDIHGRLQQMNPDLADFMEKVYRLDENSNPSMYFLLPEDPVDNPSENRQKLFDNLYNLMTEEQADMYMTQGFHEEVSTALCHHAGMSDNILVLRRQITHYPEEEKQAISRQFLDITYDGDVHRQLQQNLRLLTTRVERIVSNECILKWSPAWSDVKRAQQGQETHYIMNMCQKVDDKLKAAVSRMVERQTSVNPYLAAGLPPVLCQELLMHAHKQQLLQAACTAPPTWVGTTLSNMREDPGSPLIMQGSSGCGLQTLASIMALHETEHNDCRMVVLRFMTLTPESQTVMAVLITALEQVIIAFGGVQVFHALKDLSCESILSGVARAAGTNSVTIIICSLSWDMLGQDKDTRWLTKHLPPNIQLIVLSDCPKLCTELKCVKVPRMELEQAEHLFLTRLHRDKRRVTPAQHQVVLATLRENPLPSMAVILASLALEWHSEAVVTQKDVPRTPEEAFICLSQQAEKAVGQTCVRHILSYISTAKFGLTDSELEDVLAMDDQLLISLYPKQRLQVRRCPLSIWLYLKTKFQCMLDLANVYGHAVHRWQKQMTPSLVLNHYRQNHEYYHANLTDYFKGSWAKEPKPLPDPTRNGTPVPSWCCVLEQPNSYCRYINCRKFLCLLHHMLHVLPCSDDDSSMAACSDRSAAAKQHLLNIRWLVIKLDATSLVQLLDDLQMAICTAPAMSTELSWLQLLVAKTATMLNISGRQVYTCLYGHILKNRDSAVPKDCDMKRKISFKTAMSRLELSVTKSSVPFFVLKDVYDPSSGTTSDTSSSTEEPVGGKSDQVDLPIQENTAQNCVPCCLNGFYRVDQDGRKVVSICTSNGEIVVWDTTRHEKVKTLRDINKPSNLVFLDSQRVVVLCDRELKTYDLETGTVISNIRGMLNLKMPYFHVRDADTVIVMARNRMSVNVLDVQSGQIHATFKAGEDRFLNSLLVSGNGKIMVCGDETQKPFPLLVWELGQSKLLHDLRIPQHEFITSIADITYEGNYVACACRGLYDTTYNFMVVYDLTSGQLYRQFRMSASVTAVRLASSSLCVVMTLNDGSVVCSDIESGNCKFHVDGVKAIFNRLQLSVDETLAVTYTVNAGSMPIACTVAAWDLTAGRFLASYTFDWEVTCCQHVAHNSCILVGLVCSQRYAVLSFFNKHSLRKSSSKDSFGRLDSPNRTSSDTPLWRLV